MFQAFPKIPRLNRPVEVTEKIDGSNACVIVSDEGVFAQSRKRIITPGKSTDNFGFAAWVEQHADLLRQFLGNGYHYGEWFGRGIQRGYGMDDRKFALFNPSRYQRLWEIEDDGCSYELVDAGLMTVPILGYLPTLLGGVGLDIILEDLREQGSSVASSPAEGVVLFHSSSRQVFKVLLEDDDIPKGLAS